jgi:hypothetical protein
MNIQNRHAFISRRRLGEKLTSPTVASLALRRTPRRCSHQQSSLQVGAICCTHSWGEVLHILVYILHNCLKGGKFHPCLHCELISCKNSSFTVLQQWVVKNTKTSVTNIKTNEIRHVQESKASTHPECKRNLVVEKKKSYRSNASNRVHSQPGKKWSLVAPPH